MGNKTTEIIKFETPELSALEPSRAEQIRKVFEPMVVLVAGFETAYNGITAEANNEITDDVMSRARRLRLDMAKIRNTAEKARKAQKAEYLLAGKAIDATSHLLTWAVQKKEDKLMEIEKHFEIEKKRQADELQAARAAELATYVGDDYRRDDLHAMDDETWTALLAAKKRAHDDVIAAKEKAEEDRIAAEEERVETAAKLVAENAKLKADMKLAQIAKRASERKAKAEYKWSTRAAVRQERANRKTQEKELQRLKEENERVEQVAEKERKEAAEKLRKVKKAAKEKSDAVEAELKEKLREEARKEKDRADRLEAELSRDDGDKMDAFVYDLEVLKSKYVFKSKGNRKIYAETCRIIDKAIERARGKA